MKKERFVEIAVKVDKIIRCDIPSGEYRKYVLNENILRLMTTNDQTVCVDISEEICQKHGFSHAEVRQMENVEITLIGVGPDNVGQDTVWYIIHSTNINGRACYGNARKMFGVYKRK